MREPHSILRPLATDDDFFFQKKKFFPPYCLNARLNQPLNLRRNYVFLMGDNTFVNEDVECLGISR